MNHATSDPTSDFFNSLLNTVARGIFPAAYQQCQAGLRALPPLWYARRIILKYQDSEAYQSTSEEASTATRETVISLAKAVKEASARYEAMLASPAFKFVLAFREKSENLVNSLRSVKLILDEVGIFFDPGGWTTSLTLDEDGLQRPTGLIVPAADISGESTLYHR